MDGILGFHSVSMGGIVGLIVLVLDIIAIVDVLKSSLDATMKLLWVILILVLPVIGMVLYFLIGKKHSFFGN